MTARQSASVSTANGSRYLQQLCKHWSHKFETNFTTERGSIDLPLGRVEMEAGPDRLDVSLAAAPGQEEKMRQVFEDHINRFAFREAPLPFEWRQEEKA